MHRMGTEPPSSPVVGCVGFLNAGPLIDGLEGVSVRFDVPSRLTERLLRGETTVALCPVIDYHRSATPLELVPSGSIACAGPTLTVRLFSRRPLERLRSVHVDGDSHTSVALLRVLLAERLGRVPTLRPLDPARDAEAEAVLLIGDKVVTNPPPAGRFPHQWDLGRMWAELTGLPFPFAMWMTRQGTELGDLPERLARTRRRNQHRIAALARAWAPHHGWSAAQAETYLGRMLRHDAGPDVRGGMERFAALAERHGVIESAQPLRLAEGATAACGETD
jgi:chorismate dehydratase